MCDIGRFQYTWVESEQRLRKPLILGRDGLHQVATWTDALTKARDLIEAAVRRDAASVRFVSSAHASHEELFLIKTLATSLGSNAGVDHVHVSWRRSEKRQPPDTKF